MGALTKSPYLTGPDLLFCHNGCVTRAVQLDFGEADMLPAGTPISPEGKVANDVTALGILKHDTYKDFGSGRAELVISGHIKLAEAQEHCGVTYTAEAKAAMKQIVFVGDTEVPSGGGGSAEDTVHAYRVDSDAKEYLIDCAKKLIYPTQIYHSVDMELNADCKVTKVEGYRVRVESNEYWLYVWSWSLDTAQNSSLEYEAFTISKEAYDSIVESWGAFPEPQ